VAVQPLIELALGLYTGMLSLFQQYGGNSGVEVVQGKEA
jgi:hypothetical protein